MDIYSIKVKIGSHLAYVSFSFSPSSQRKMQTLQSDGLASRGSCKLKCRLKFTPLPYQSPTETNTKLSQKTCSPKSDLPLWNIQGVH